MIGPGVRSFGTWAPNFLLLSLAFWPAAVAGQTNKSKDQDTAPTATLTAEQVIDGLLDTYSRFRKIPGLVVEYRIDHQILEKTSFQIWGWPWAEFVNKIRPGEPGKLFLCFRRPGPGKNGEVINQNIETSDGEFKAMLTSIVGGNIGKSRTFTKGLLTPSQRLNTIPMFCYYFTFLSWPVSADPEVGQAKREVYPAKDYWLPEALATNRKAYQVRPVLEKVDGVACHVLERHSFDVIWGPD